MWSSVAGCEDEKAASTGGWVNNSRGVGASGGGGVGSVATTGSAAGGGREWNFTGGGGTSFTGGAGEVGAS